MRKPPYSHRQMPGPTTLSGGKRGVEGHVRFLVVLPEPGHEIRKLLSATVFVENDDDAADAAGNAAVLPHVQPPLVEVADRLPHVYTVEQRRGERLRPPLFTS